LAKGLETFIDSHAFQTSSTVLWMKTLQPREECFCWKPYRWYSVISPEDTGSLPDTDTN